MLLQANNLSCVREDRTLFEHLSFAVRAGDLMQIEGPNGWARPACCACSPASPALCWRGVLEWGEYPPLQG